ncbi:hypothetical protein MSAN_02173900 [Mycena sanguinolenta]|uniref:Uncharacterized protein n=1 Tax=Mycena sanguinolenta TaxID=230812 RepID=A0A8H7CJ45_9AGAR|nr:hypothetical protein MSAN_02173900 [Mycena sanguinolenta]
MNGYPNYPTTSAEALNALNNFPNPNNINAHPPDHAEFSGMRQPPQQPPMHPMAPQQNWMQQQPQHYPHPPPMQHPHYPPQWPQNQIPPHAFHNGMAALPLQQVLLDAVAMSQPVERADEQTLVKALVESRARGETYKDALNRLHGVSNHSANLWKDYYLDHKDRLDLATQTYAASGSKKTEMTQNAAASGPKKTVKKPSISAFKAESSPISSSAMSTSSPGPSKPRRPSQKPAQPSRTPSRTSSHVELPTNGSRRQTINSITSHMLVYNERLPPPNTELKIPEPPSRSPSPPTEVIPHNRGGHKFTPYDREYFIKFIQWRLKSDPTLVRSELCELLAEKAPHHTAQSWAAYWQNHHDLPDKIVASAREGEHPDSEDEEPKPKKRKKAARPKYKEVSSESELTEDSEQEEQEEQEDEPKEPEDENDDDIEIPPFDESAMGLKGGPFTKADLGVIARHVASFTAAEFEEASMQDKWGEIARRYPQRALKSWGEYYRRNQNTIDKLARKIRKLNEAEAERQMHAQPMPLPPPAPAPLPTPKPLWASENIGTHGPPRTKRKFEESAAGEAFKARDHILSTIRTPI